MLHGESLQEGELEGCLSKDKDTQQYIDQDTGSLKLLDIRFFLLSFLAWIDRLHEIDLSVIVYLVVAEIGLEPDVVDEQEEV